MQDVIERLRLKANERMQKCYDDLEEIWNEFNRELDRRSAIMRGDPAPAGPAAPAGLPNVADGPQLGESNGIGATIQFERDFFNAMVASAIIRGEK